ncbi:MAG TPA: hypothetical protein VE422_08070 [Terriglobia bacterium]|nr:hypothetical protein [Terriglobia bacterium]
MVQDTNKIKQHIDTERAQLGGNLNELEDRVRKATDLKAHFNNNTGLILGAAVAGGFLLSLAFRKSAAPGSTSNRETEPMGRSAQPRRSIPAPLQRVSQTLDSIFEGLTAVVAARLESFVADAVPGFREQYRAMDRQQGGPGVRQMRHDPGGRATFQL